MFGRQSLELNNFSLGAARFSSVFGLLAMPIFNAGRTQAINDIAESAQSEALIRYEDGIVRALEDVENALVVLRDERQRTESLQTASASAQAALGRAQSLYNRGQIDLLPLLDAQRTRLIVQVSANDSSTQLLLDSVQLYKALGGGWEGFGAAVGPAASSTPRAATASAAILAAGTQNPPPAEAPRPVRAVELRYDRVSDGNRYVGTVQARHEVDQAFRVGGKITERRVDVGHTVREGDVLAGLDDVDYRLTEEATRQELIAATAQAQQAESDRRRLEALKKDGSVSIADDEHARSGAEKAQAAAEA